ncbi:MAG: hypothetical protein ACRD25_02095, partial [Terracidiphilus sp.]
PLIAKNAMNGAQPLTAQRTSSPLLTGPPAKQNVIQRSEGTKDLRFYSAQQVHVCGRIALARALKGNGLQPVRKRN